jgi:hypothetical protein
MRRVVLLFLASSMLLVPTPACGQTDPLRLLPTTELAQRIHKIQDMLLRADIVGDPKTDRSQRERGFETIESMVSDYVVAQVEASPAIRSWELRNRLITVLGVSSDDRIGPDHFHEAPYVFLDDPVFREATNLPQKPFTFSVVYVSSVCPGFGCSRMVIESYAIDQGKVRLAGRGGSEMNGVEARAQQVGTDELLIQGQVTWESGHVLPFKAALYRANEAGVKALWQTSKPALNAAVFEGHLFVEYHDENRDSGFNDPRRLDVYSLDNGVPRLVFHREF